MWHGMERGEQRAQQRAVSWWGTRNIPMRQAETGGVRVKDSRHAHVRTPGQQLRPGSAGGRGGSVLVDERLSLGRHRA